MVDTEFGTGNIDPLSRKVHTHDIFACNFWGIKDHQKPIYKNIRTYASKENSLKEITQGTPFPMHSCYGMNYLSLIFIC